MPGEVPHDVERNCTESLHCVTISPSACVHAVTVEPVPARNESRPQKTGDGAAVSYRRDTTDGWLWLCLAELGWLAQAAALMVRSAQDCQIWFDSSQS
eukprot:SAG22_NODE_99_length_20560_cov_128.669029_11_plen_98_part_00